MISVSDDFQCQVVWLLAHKKRLFKLLHIGNDADYSLEKRIEKWKKLLIFSGKWPFKTHVFSAMNYFLTLS